MGKRTAIAALITIALLSVALAVRCGSALRVPVVERIHTSYGRVTAMAAGPGGFCIGTDGGVVHVDAASERSHAYNTADGLPGNRVTAMASVGVPSAPGVAVGTSRGLAVYGFSGNRLDEGDWPRLNGRVAAICADGDGVLAAADSRVYRCDGPTAQWQALGPPLPAQVRCLAGFAGTTWAGTAGGLFRYDGESWERIVHRDDPLAATINAILPDGDRLYVATAAGLYRGPNAWRSWTAADGLPDSHVTSLVAGESMLFAGTYGGGLARLDDGDAVHPLGGPSYITSLVCLPGAAPVAERLWVGAEAEGVFSFADGNWRRGTVIPGGMADSNVTCLAADGSGVWVGAFEHGVSRYDGDNGWRAFGLSDGLSSTWINHMAFGHGRAWARTSAGDLHVCDGESWRQVTKAVSGIAKDWTSSVQAAGGHIWTGTWGAVGKFDGSAWHNYAPKPALEGKVVTSVAVDGKSIWVGTAKSGLRRYDGGTGEWDTFSLGSGLSDTWVTSLAIWRDDLWVGTFSGGICRFDGRDWTHFRASTSLPSDRINTLVATDCLYAGTLDGLCRYDGDQWRTYGPESGLPCEIVQALATSADRLYIGTPEGLAEATLIPETKLANLP